MKPSRPTHPLHLLAMSCCAIACLSLSAFAQDKKQPTMTPAQDTPKKGADTPDNAAKSAMHQAGNNEKDAWMAAGMPNENHKLLEEMAGRWDMKAVTTMPEAPPTESKGEMHSYMTLGGRFLHGKFKGDMMGMPFDGVSVMGYDNTAKKFVGTWMDSMSTNIMHEWGTYDAATKTITMKGEFTDPTTNKPVKTRSTTKMTDTDHYTMTFYHTMADGKENKVMEITATRTAKAEPEPMGESYKKVLDDATKKAKDATPKSH